MKKKVIYENEMDFRIPSENDYEKDVANYLAANHRFYDRFHDIILMDNLLCCNFDDLDTIQSKFDALPESGYDTLSLMTHEQYCYSDYFNYIPNHLDRIEFACKMASLKGYKPVFFNEGVMGNTQADS